MRQRIRNASTCGDVRRRTAPQRNAPHAVWMDIKAELSETKAEWWWHCRAACLHGSGDALVLIRSSLTCLARPATHLQVHGWAGLHLVRSLYHTDYAEHRINTHQRRTEYKTLRVFIFWHLLSPSTMSFLEEFYACITHYNSSVNSRNVWIMMRDALTKVTPPCLLLLTMTMTMMIMKWLYVSDIPPSCGQ